MGEGGGQLGQGGTSWTLGCEERDNLKAAQRQDHHHTTQKTLSARGRGADSSYVAFPGGQVLLWKAFFLLRGTQIWVERGSPRDSS